MTMDDKMTQKLVGIITVPFHIGDFLSGTLHMDTLEKGAFIMLLLAHYQIGECGLPNDDKKLARIAGVSVKVWLRIKPVLAEKFTIDEHFWRNKKAIEVLQKVEEKSSAQRAKALKRHNAVDATAMPRQCQPKPKPKPVVKDISNDISKKPDDSKKGARLKDDWTLPVEWGLWALEQGLTREVILTEEEKFRDYWVSLAGAKAIKRDWQAAWRNWIRNKLERGY